MRNILPILALLLIAGCGKTAGPGTEVKFHYEMKVDGKTIEKTEPDRPMEIVLGKDRVMRGLEEILEGMKKGEVRRIELPPEKAFGKFDPGLIERIPKERFGALNEGLKQAKSFRE